MMSSDKMPGAAPHPTVPSRSSSITATSRGRPSLTPRHSLPLNPERLAASLNKPSNLNSTSGPASPRSQSPLAQNMNRNPASYQTTTESPSRPAKVQRWAGLTRSVSNWDDLRRDPELWSQDGDCHVHLYARGISRRGPSFRVHLRALRQKNCGAMLNVCYAQSVPSGAAGTQGAQRLSSLNNLNRGPNLVELYIPAPQDTSREDSFNWHITTRNFFAYVMGKPLVGHHMGDTFVNLQERMKLFRDGHADNHNDFLQYIEEQGYRDMVECTDYAIASLYYAERYKLRPMWIDAFTHCVGMNESLALSPEYTSISRLTKALIARASLEVDLHLGKVSKALRVFLQDDFSPAHLGLAEGARSHMDRFRRFLHHYYVGKFGYWPPPRSTTTFPKALYKSMFYDFKNLYEYLADTASTTDLTSQKPASGGICVLQNLDHFDKRHKFAPQPYPLPHLPEEVRFIRSSSSHKISRTFSSASQQKTPRDTQSKSAVRSAALAAAANMVDPGVVNSKIVQAYREFEKSYATNSSQREDKLTAVDARKVRWLLIYGTLQYLASALRAPKEVRDTESPEYPLCCLVAPQSSWSSETPLTTPPLSVSAVTPRATDDYFSRKHGGASLAIQPDCQREDYFTSKISNRSEPVDSSAQPKSQLPSRQNSLRSFGPLQSLSLSARSSRRNSLRLKSTPHCAIMVQAYGDGLNHASLQTTTSSSLQYDVTQESSSTSQQSSSESANFEEAWLKPRPSPEPVESPPIPSIRGHSRQRTPLLHTFQLEEAAQPIESATSADSMTRSDSTSSTTSSVWTDEGSAASSKSSATGGVLYKSSAAEYSGLLGGLVSVSGSPVRFDTPSSRNSMMCIPEGDIHPLLRQASADKDEFKFDFNSQPAELSSSTDTLDKTGMAFSEPSSSSQTPLAATQHNALFQCVLSSSEEVQPASSSAGAISRKKTRSTDILSVKRSSFVGTTTTNTEDKCYGFRFESHPPTVTKTSHASKAPSLINRILDDAKDKKKERRLSSFWRR